MLESLSNTRLRLLLLGASIILFVPFLGAVHLFDWDEINFAEMAREMVVSGDYLRVTVDFAPFWEKPPLFMWLQALGMHAFGVGELAARLPNAICGIIALQVILWMGMRLQGRQLGVLWVLAYAGSLLPFFYFRSGIIDPFFNLFMVLGLFHIHLHYQEPARRWQHIAVSGVFIGLAILTKGPVGMLLPGLAWCIYWIIRRRQFSFPLLSGMLWVLVALATTSLWFLYDLIANGPFFLREFFEYQYRLLATDKEAGHTGFLLYHFVVLFLGTFPASIFFWRSLHSSTASASSAMVGEFRLLMIILLCVVLVVFTIVTEKIVHYSSLGYYPITFLAALALQGLMKGQPAARYMRVLLLVLGSVWALAFLALPAVGFFANDIATLVLDPFAAGNLQADVPWTGLEFGIGLGYAAIVFFAHRYLRAGAVLRSAWVLFGGTAITLALVMPFIVPKIEGYSQRAAIEFFESKQGCDCYVTTLDYKSYAHLFYARRQPQQSALANGHPKDFNEWLMNGPITKPAYFVVKAKDAQYYRDEGKLKEIGSKNGFVFFERQPPKP